MSPFERIRSRRLLPAVASLKSADDAVLLADALLAGGLDVMEITLRHESSLGCIAAIAEKVPGMSCGAGTILHPEQVDEVIGAGGKFGVSPGYNPETIIAASDRGLPFIPGVATPGEIEQSMALGCELLKVFPTESLGGLGFLRAISGPYAHTRVGVVPMGGISLDSCSSYLALPIVAAVGMSALTPSAAIEVGDWEGIAESTRKILKAAQV